MYEAMEIAHLCHGGSNDGSSFEIITKSERERIRKIRNAYARLSNDLRHYKVVLLGKTITSYSANELQG